MTPEEWGTIIQAVGFPITSAIAMAWALWKLGSKLLESHLAMVDAAKKQMETANLSLTVLTSTLNTQVAILNTLVLETHRIGQESEKHMELLKSLPDHNKASLEKVCKFVDKE